VSRRRVALRSILRFPRHSRHPHRLYCHECDQLEQVFQCQDCAKWVPWCVGGDDDNRCAACWFAHYSGERTADRTAEDKENP